MMWQTWQIFTSSRFSPLAQVLERAVAVNDVLNVHNSLKSIQAEIDALTARLKHWERASAMSKLDISVEEWPTPQSPLSLGFGSLVMTRLRVVWSALRLVLVNVVVFTVVFLQIGVAVLIVGSLLLVCGAPVLRLASPYFSRLWRLGKPEDRGSQS